MEHETANLIFSATHEILKTNINDIGNIGEYIPIPKIDPKTLMKLFDSSIEILKTESSLLRISGNFVVVGDLHGNYRDLIRILIFNGVPPQTNYLFLGDYVDRGSFSIEVFELLFSMKILFPKNVYLLRGNHEEKETNERYGLYDEIQKVYGENSIPLDNKPEESHFLQSQLINIQEVLDEGEEQEKVPSAQEIWERMNNVFDYLPLACVLNETTFCVHGGISKHLHSLEDIEKIKLPLTTFSPLVTDLLWSDPCEPLQHYSNNERGKGCMFGANAIAKFLKDTNMEIVVRGHQCINKGVQFLHMHNFVTVFSSSGYSGEKNYGGYIIIHPNQEIEKFVFYPLAPLSRDDASFFNVKRVHKYKLQKSDDKKGTSALNVAMVKAQQSHRENGMLRVLSKVRIGGGLTTGGICSSTSRLPQIPAKPVVAAIRLLPRNGKSLERMQTCK